ncbi:MAG: glycosyltransferase family 39 protein [Anaerolineae bacterium]
MQAPAPPAPPQPAGTPPAQAASRRFWFQPRLGSWNRWLTLGALLLGFALRVVRLGDQNIWWDEGLATWAVRQGFLATTRWTAGDVHPPLYFWTLWPWVRLVGESEFAFRFITVVVGTLTIAAVIVLGRALAGPSVGVLAGLLLATARFHIWWSQEMRMYALAGLMSTLALYALVRWWRSGERRAWLGYILAATAGLYTIYLSVVMLLAANLWALGMLVAAWRRKAPGVGRRLGAWVAAQIIVVLLFAPWLAYALGKMSSWSVAEPVNFAFVAQLQATLLTLGISTDIDRVLLPALALTLIFAAGVILLLRRPAARAGVALLLLVLALPCLIIFLLALPRGLFYNPRVEARYFLPFAPPVYVLFAWSLWALWQWRRVAGWVAGIAVAAAIFWTLPQYYAPRYLRDDLQGMVQVLRAYARPEDAVVLVSGSRYPVFLYYFEGGMAAKPPVEQIPHNALTLAADNVDREMRAATRGHDRIWLASVNGPLQDPDGLADAWLRQHYKPALSYGFDHNSLTLFTADGAPPPLAQSPTRPLDLPLGDGRVTGYDLPAREYRPGDTVRVGVYWDGPAADVRVGLAPVRSACAPKDPGCAPWVARPVRLPDGPARVQVELPVLQFMQPAPYMVVVDRGDERAAFGQPRVSGSQTPGLPPLRGDSRVGDDIRLQGVRIVGANGREVTQARPGDAVYVDLYWAADAPVSADYTVFVHLLGGAFNPATGGPVWVGHDGPPSDGAYPTSWWDGRTVVRDRHPLVLPEDIPPGEYTLELGMYGADGQRLPTAGVGADPVGGRITAPGVTIAP